MNTRHLRAALAVAALGFVPAAALAQQERAPSTPPGSNTIKVRPFQFGLGALATWARDAGEPSTHGAGGDPQQYGLLLQKLTTTPTFAAAGASLFDGHMQAEALHVLSFDISGFPGMAFGTANGYCGAGAPRFNVDSDASATCFLGCAHGDKVQDPQTGWWTISFRPPFTQYPGCEGGVTGTVHSIALIFDEGNDVGPGSVVVDDITVNNRTIGRPQGSEHED